MFLFAHSSGSDVARLIRRAAAASILLFACTAAVTPTVFAAPGDEELDPQPWTGEPGIVETIAEIEAREHLFAFDGKIRTTGKPKRIQPDRSRLPQDPNSPAVSQWPEPDGQPQPGGYEQRSPQTITVDYASESISESGYIPPDTMGDVSPTQVITYTNGRLKIWNKSGGLTTNLTANNFFNSVRNASNVVDPRIVWDRTTNRWFVAGMTVTTPNRIVIAVSNSATVTNTSSFTFYQFQQDLVGTTPNADTGAFADYPSFGVDANALYVGCNMFSGNFYGATGWVVRKSSVTSGGPIVVTAFRQIIAGAGGAGPFAPRGVTNYDPAATTGYFIGPDNSASGRLVLRRISTPGGTPTISGNINLTVPTTADPEPVPAMGSTINIETTNDRLFDARISRNRFTNTWSLWTAHSIEVNTSGVASTSGGRNGARWYEIRNFTGTPSLFQSGTLFDNAASAPDYFIYPSVAMTGQGHMALGATVAATDRFLSAAFAGRVRTDAVATIRPMTIIEPGVASYTVDLGAGRNRWGDYSSTVVDPADDQTIWTFQEYASATNVWSTRVTKLMAPLPATPTSCSPSSVSQGDSNINITLTGSTLALRAFYDTEAGYNRIAAAFSGTGITVNSVTFVSESSLTINVSVTPSAAATARDVTITNPDGQTAVGTALLTVIASCPVPSITDHPDALTVCEGDPASFTAAGTGSGTISYQWRKNGADIGGANSSTYTIAATTGLDGGTYDCRITNTCVSGSANILTTGALLTVNACGCIVTCDYNQDGGGDTTDVIELADAIATGTDPYPGSCKDYNQDGGADTSDVIDMADAIASGTCP